MNIYRQFNWVFLTVALLPVLSIGLFNIFIDPYGAISSPIFPGINKLKPEQDEQAQLFKALDIMRLKPTTVFIGSSTVMRGLEPTHPGLLDDPNAYNLGTFAAHIDDVTRYLKYTIANQPKFKRVVIGIDFFMFNGSSKGELGLIKSRQEPIFSMQNLLDVIFSLKALEASKLTVVSNLQNSDVTPYFVKGRRTYNPYLSEQPRMLDRFKLVIRGYFTNPAFYKDYRLTSSLLTELRTINDICKQHNLEVKVFISPVHAAQLEAIRVAGLWPVFEQWKREVVQVMPVWDFSNYDTIATEPISDEMKNFIDSAHYRKEVGDLVLNRLLDYHQQSVPNDFGVLITPANIESHLAKNRSGHEVWAKKNPNVVKLVQDIKLKLDEKNKRL